MDVMPSSNYKKLLNDFSNIQNSSDIIEENDDDDKNEQFFDVEED